MTTTAAITPEIATRILIHKKIVEVTEECYSEAFVLWDYMTPAALMMTTVEVTGDRQITLRLVEQSEAPERVRIAFDGAITRVLDQVDAPAPATIHTVNDYTVHFTW